MTAFNIETLHNITKTNEKGELTKEYIENVILPLADLGCEDLECGSFYPCFAKEWKVPYTDPAVSVYSIYQDFADEWEYTKVEMVEAENIERQVDVDVFENEGLAPTCVIEFKNNETNEHYRVTVSFGYTFNYRGEEEYENLSLKDCVEIEVL